MSSVRPRSFKMKLRGVGLWARPVHTISIAAHLVSWTRRAASGSWVRVAAPASSSAACLTQCRTWNLLHRRMYRVRGCTCLRRCIHTDYPSVSVNDVSKEAPIFNVCVQKDYFSAFLTISVSVSQQQCVVRGCPRCKTSHSLAPGSWVALLLLQAAGPGWLTSS